MVPDIFGCGSYECRFSLLIAGSFGPDRNAEGVAIGFGCVVCCVCVCLNFFGIFFSSEVQS